MGIDSGLAEKPPEKEFFPEGAQDAENKKSDPRVEIAYRIIAKWSAQVDDEGEKIMLAGSEGVQVCVCAGNE